jgi:ABC-type transport system substrate-binding protein
VLYQGLPPDEIARLKETPEYEQYPGLGTYYYGFNVKNITDVKQRRAMSLAIDRQSIIDNVAQGGQLPTTGFTPKGMPGFDVLNPNSPWQPATADMEQAKKLMSEVANPKKNITLYINDSPGHREIAVAIQAAWKELGITSTIKQQEFQQYLEFLGPPPNSDVDVYRLGWIGDYVDAMNFLEQWTCELGTTTRTSATELRRLVKARNSLTKRSVRDLRQLEDKSSARTAQCRSSRSTGTRTSAREDVIKETFN